MMYVSVSIDNHAVTSMYLSPCCLVSCDWCTR